MRKSKIVVLIIIIISLLISIYFYPKMPNRIPSHWNRQGEVDGEMPKFWGLFLMPIVLSVMLVLFIIIPKLDPLKANIEKFRKYFDGFIILLLLFMLFIQLFIILWTQGIKMKPYIIFPIGLGTLFFYIGILLENAKRNWFIGIRNPWTLSNDIVWDKTHKLGGKLFKVIGLIGALGIFFGKHAFWFIIIPIIITVVYLFIFSYIEYKKVIT